MQIRVRVFEVLAENLRASGSILVCAAVLCLSSIPSAIGQEAETPPHPLVPAIRVARASLEAAEKVRDFEASFTKRDVVNGYLHAHTMQVKFRTEPMSVYMKFSEPHEGREVIYVHGKNEGNLLAHEAGIKSIVGTISLDPRSERALSESRYPITQMGLAKLVEGIITQWESEVKYGEIDVKHYPNATHPRMGKREFQVIESSHPIPRREFKFHRTRLWIDKETGLPVRVEQYGFPRREGERAPLLEEYTYSDIRTNVGLQDIDFDVRNPRYAF